MNLSDAIRHVLHAGECADQVSVAELRALDRVYFREDAPQNVIDRRCAYGTLRFGARQGSLAARP